MSACAILATEHKMAAYNKDEFYTESDFSDLSDDEIERIANFAEQYDVESEDDEPDKTYCTCRQPGTTEMVACDNDLCDIEWFHYECVGLSSETVPEDSWICDRCRPGPSDSHMVDLEEPPCPDVTPESATNADMTEGIDSSCQPQPTTASKKKASKRQAKEQDKSSTGKVEKESKKQKKTVERPAAKFTEEDAKEKAKSYFQEGLDNIRTHPVYSDSYPLALCIMALVTNLLAMINTSEFSDFSVFLVSQIWVIASVGDEQKLGPDASAMMWRAFENLRTSNEYVNNWHKFLRSVDIRDEGKHTRIVFHHLLQFILQLVLKDRHSSDKPTEELDEEIQKISNEEEQVLRYVAGYIPYALYKKFQKHKNKVAEVYCKLLYSWKVSSCHNVKTFLEYSNEWINLQNRGGLFRVSDDLYIFFRTLENESRTLLTKANLDRFPGVNIKSSLFDKMLAQRRVRTYWCSLTQSKITGENSKRLLDIVVNYYIKIRCKAFIRVYLDLKKSSAMRKASEKKVSKKAEKALRKELASTSSGQVEKSV